MPIKQQQPYPEDRPLECGSCRKGIAVRYTEVVGDSITHTIMCKDCPELERRLYGIAAAQELSSGEAGLCCGNCGTTLVSVRSGSFLGCTVCYDVFGDVILKELEAMSKISSRLQQTKRGMAAHVGRSPGESKAISPSQKLVALNEALRETLEREDYEQAAWIRDQIKEITEKKDEA